MSRACVRSILVPPTFHKAHIWTVILQTFHGKPRSWPSVSGLAFRAFQNWERQIPDQKINFRLKHVDFSWKTMILRVHLRYFDSSKCTLWSVIFFVIPWNRNDTIIWNLVITGLGTITKKSFLHIWEEWRRNISYLTVSEWIKVIRPFTIFNQILLTARAGIPLE